LTLGKTRELPAGPWVYPHSFLKKLSCFSCGCSCYEDFSVQMQNAQIYAMVGGKAVESRHQGLYKLLAPPASENARWVLVAQGPDINPQFAVSPDGCHVAYSRQGQVFVASVCEERT
jgi:hypothetical protein